MYAERLVKRYLKVFLRDLKVNFEDPDITVGVEVREKEAYVYVDILKGAGSLHYKNSS